MLALSCCRMYNVTQAGYLRSLIWREGFKYRLVMLSLPLLLFFKMVLFLLYFLVFFSSSLFLARCPFPVSPPSSSYFLIPFPTSLFFALSLTSLLRFHPPFLLFFFFFSRPPSSHSLPFPAPLPSGEKAKVGVGWRVGRQSSGSFRKPDELVT